MLPNLLVIGVMKCGSTSLHDYLNQHPDIFMSETKELDYFVEEKNLNNGLEWYKSQFPIDAKYRGESSINYFKGHLFKGVSERIQQTLENPKFILIVRNPVARLISHYTENLVDEYEERSFEDAFSSLDDNHYIECSKYYYQLTFYLKHFNKENFYVVEMEELQKSPLEVMNCIFEFLSLQRLEDAKPFQNKLNASSQKKYRNKFGKFISNNILSKGVKSLIPSQLYRPITSSKAYSGLVKNKTKKHQFDPNTLTKIESYISEDKSEFKKFTNHTIKNW